MLCAERLLTDGQRAAVERLGLRVVAFVAVKQGEAIERIGRKRMFCAERLLTEF